MKRIHLTFSIIVGLGAIMMLLWMMSGPALSITAADGPAAGQWMANSDRALKLTANEVTRTNYLPLVTAGASNYPKWAASGHADAEDEPFTHWDDADPLEVPITCAKCHSTPGILDFLGADGSPAGIVDSPAPTGTVITCDACHNDAAETWSTVFFPSDAEITGLGREAVCLECHQGRNSTAGVNGRIDASGAGDDEVSSDLSFLNPHYYPAGATLYGTDAQGAYEYAGKPYQGRLVHIQSMNTCITCHETHGLWIEIQLCSACHDVQTEDDLDDIRKTPGDFDGDGDETEGLAGEIYTMEEALLPAIQAYATITAGTDLVYDRNSFPYFFIDANGNGVHDPDETERYASWTPRLLRAAYNYQWVRADEGAYAHNGRYILQILYDSLDDIGADVASMTRP